MRLIDEIIVHRETEVKSIRIYTGDLSSIPESEKVDLLVVSAFPNNYVPTRSSLIGALWRNAGISVKRLARSKALDLRAFSACWLSHPLKAQNVHFNQILCFEPSILGDAPEVVGDIFRCLVPIASAHFPVKSIAMPILASGDQGQSPKVMLKAMLEAAVHWLEVGLPLECIKIVAYRPDYESWLPGIIAPYKKMSSPEKVVENDAEFQYDFFLSYSHQDSGAVHRFDQMMRIAYPATRVFLDRLKLSPGMAWQSTLFEALDQCQKVIPFFSPAYLESKVCKEEFNIALYRHRESNEGVLLPIYLHDASLPTYMKMIQYIDCREADAIRLQEAIQILVA